MLRFRSRAASPGAALLAFSLAACAGDQGPVAPAPPETRQPELVRLSCTASVAERTVVCASPTPGEGGARGVIVGGQGTYVQLTSSNVSYTAATQTLQFDVTVQNLIPQPMGTTDGTTPSATGVRVFFTGPPSTTVGSGTVTVQNEDGQGVFTASGQDYFQYSGALLGADGILGTSETSGARTWQMHVPTTALTFRFSLYVAADVPFPKGYVDVSPAADSLLEGATQPLTATVRNVVGEVVPGAAVTWGSSDTGVLTVDAGGVVTAVSAGSGMVTATSGERTGSAAIAVCPSLAAGAVRAFGMPAGASLCLGGGGGGAEYTVVPVNTDDVAAIALGVTGSGITGVTGGPTPLRAGTGARLAGVRRGAWSGEDYAFSARLRRTGARERAGRAAARSAAGGSVRRAITPGVPAVGALMSINVQTANFCSTFDTRTGRVQAVGTHAIVLADTSNPSGGFTAADYQALADSFDAFVHPVLQANFGAPADIDGNGRVILFYTRGVNQQTDAAGFFLWRDLRPATECPTSNVGELLYLAVPDGSGTVGTARSKAAVYEHTFRTMAHEGAQLINASRRMYVNTPWSGELEEAWLDEALGDVAEELVFYSRSGLAPGANLDVADIGGTITVQDAFFRYASPNVFRLAEWLRAPHAAGLVEPDAPDSASRGAAWAFLRYAADRKGGAQASTWGALVNTQATGLASLQAALGTDPLPWLRDFDAAMYADDAVPSPAAAYTQPSWNFRDLYSGIDLDPGPDCSCAFPLVPRNPSNGVQDSFTLDAGGAAAYLRMRVPASAFAGVTVRTGGVAPPSTVRLAVIRRN
ncbi:MAG TPA: Ig-like domain-containing protein [Longimicrobium sp.]|nr:Ig-like domain-containing protein [Longimicrobium sp.]